MLLEDYKEKHYLSEPEFISLYGSMIDYYSSSKVSFTNVSRNTTAKLVTIPSGEYGMFDGPILKRIKEPFNLSFKGFIGNNGYVMGTAKVDGSTNGLAIYTEDGMLKVALHNGYPIAVVETPVTLDKSTRLYTIEFDGHFLKLFINGTLVKSAVAEVGEGIEVTSPFYLAMEDGVSLPTNMSISDFVITDNTPYEPDRFAVMDEAGVFYTYKDNTWSTIKETQVANDGILIEELGKLTDAIMLKAPGEKLLWSSKDNRANRYVIQKMDTPVIIGDMLDEEFHIELDGAEEATVTKQASVLDEFEGDVYVGYWSADGTNLDPISVTGVPKKAYVEISKAAKILNRASYFRVTDVSTGYIKRSRYVFSSTEDSTRYTFEDGLFIEYDWTADNVDKHALKNEDLKNVDLNLWPYDNIVLGVFVDDDEYGLTKTRLTKVEFVNSIPLNSPAVTNATVYVLNTQSEITTKMEGRHLTATISDEDKTKVQYKVKLNGQNYYPADGVFTGLADPNVGIDLVFDSTRINVNAWNIVDVVFQDSFGTESSASMRFWGEYNGLLFMDDEDRYLTTDTKQLLHYLDFGEVITGQTTPEQRVRLKNTYGYDVKNVHIAVQNLHDDFEVQISRNGMEFVSEPYLDFDGVLKDGEQLEFLVRLKTTLFVTKPTQDIFTIKARAERVEEDA